MARDPEFDITRETPELQEERRRRNADHDRDQAVRLAHAFSVTAESQAKLAARHGQRARDDAYDAKQAVLEAHDHALAAQRAARMARIWAWAAGGVSLCSIVATALRVWLG